MEGSRRLRLRLLSLRSITSSTGVSAPGLILLACIVFLPCICRQAPQHRLTGVVTPFTTAGLPGWQNPPTRAQIKTALTVFDVDGNGTLDKSVCHLLSSSLTSSSSISSIDSTACAAGQALSPPYVFERCLHSIRMRIPPFCLRQQSQHTTGTIVQVRGRML